MLSENCEELYATHLGWVLFSLPLNVLKSFVESCVLIGGANPGLFLVCSHSTLSHEGFSVFFELSPDQFYSFCSPSAGPSSGPHSHWVVAAGATSALCLRRQVETMTTFSSF